MSMTEPLAVFIDTEFAGTRSHPVLISMGLVSLDGRTFYAEMPAEDYAQFCSPWVKANVLPHLNGGDVVLPPPLFRQRLSAWLTRLGPVQIVTDAPDYDFALLRQHLIPWPAHVDVEPIFFDINWFEGHNLDDLHQIWSDYFSPSRPQHHALHDAQALRRIWLAIKT